MHYRSVKEMVEANQREILQAEANLKKDYDNKRKVKKRIKIILILILLIVIVLRLIFGPLIINYHSSDFFNNKLHIISVNNDNIMASTKENRRITVIPLFVYIDVIASVLYDTQYITVKGSDLLVEEVIIPDEFLLDQTEELILPINSEIIIDLKEYECYLMYEGKEYAAHCSKNTINNSRFLETNKYKIEIFKNKEKIYNIDYTSDLTEYLKEEGDYKIIVYSKYNKDYFDTTFNIKIE